MVWMGETWYEYRYDTVLYLPICWDREPLCRAKQSKAVSKICLNGTTLIPCRELWIGASHWLCETHRPQLISICSYTVTNTVLCCDSILTTNTIP
jgi:hypothetical protein